MEKIKTNAYVIDSTQEVLGKVDVSKGYLVCTCAKYVIYTYKIIRVNKIL